MALPIDIKRNNAAARAQFWIDRALKHGNVSNQRAWAAVFEIPTVGDQAVRVVQRLALLTIELQRVEQFALDSGLDPSLWRGQLDATVGHLGLGNLAASWDDNRKEIQASGAVLSLGWIAREMPEEEAVDFVSEEVQSLRADLVSLRERIAASDLPAETRALLYRAIEEMLSAIDEAPIGGVTVVRKRAFEVYATLANHPLPDETTSPEVGTFRSLVVRFFTWTPRQQNAMQFAKFALDVLKLGFDGYRALHGDATAHKALAESAASAIESIPDN